MKPGPGLRRITLISGLGFFLALQCFATGILKGRVFRANDSVPLSGAHVRISGTKTGTITAPDGSFSFLSVQPGTIRIRVTFVGYREENRPVRLGDRSTTTENFFLVPESIVGPETEIRGKKTDRNNLDIPVRINTISSQNISDNPGQSVPQILDNISGVNLTGTMGVFGNDNVVSMRGLSGSDQGRTLVLVDDIPINKADEGTVNWNLINRENIDHISVIKGPGSVIYGGNAMGGTINIRTRFPEKPISGTVAIDYGTFNTLAGRYFLTGKAKKSTRGIYYNINGFYTRSDGYNAEIQEYLEKADTFTVNTFVREADIGAKAGYQFNPGNTVDISCNFFNDKRGRGEQIYEVDGAFERHNSWQATAHYTGEKGSFKWKMNIYNLTEYFERLNEFMREAEYNLYLVKSTRSDRGGLFALSAGPFSNNLLTFGFEGRLGSVDGQDIYYTSTDLISNEGKMENYGVFLQDEINMFKRKISIIAGIRLDYARFHEGSFTIENPSYSVEYMMHYQDTVIPSHQWIQPDPRLSLQYRFNATGRVYLSLGRGFRAPMLDDLCRTGKMRNGFKISNPALEPEYIDNAEIGGDFLLWKKLHIAPSLYYSIGHDFMYYVSTGDSVNMGYRITPVFQKRNISRVIISGAEMDLEYEPFPWLSVFANYTYSVSRIRKYTPNNPLVDEDLTGNFLTNVPEHKATAGITWKNKIISCNLIWKYIGQRWINDENEPDPVLLISKYPSYNTLGFRAWHLFFKRLKLSLNVENLTDVRFVNDKLQRNPGRMITGEISVHF
jgi:iron complex outermembrane recepter protein